MTLLLSISPFAKPKQNQTPRRALCETPQTAGWTRTGTQADTAAESRIGVRTLRRLRKGDGGLLDTAEHTRSNDRHLLWTATRPRIVSLSLPDPSGAPNGDMETRGTSRRRTPGARARIKLSRPLRGSDLDHGERKQCYDHCRDLIVAKTTAGQVQMAAVTWVAPSARLGRSRQSGTFLARRN